MKILLDECVPRPLRREMAPFTCRTVRESGWDGTNDAALLKRAAEEFDVFITTDRNLAFQQNVSRAPIAVIVLEAASNRLEDLAVLVPEVKRRMPFARPGSVTWIAVGSTTA